MKKETLAYIAGFLDGDGCIMLQLVHRKDYLLGYQIRASIVFYQKTPHRNHLEWLQSQFDGHGYIRNRPDGMSEYTIVGVQAVARILQQLKPFLRLKAEQAEITLAVLAEMPARGGQMDAEKLLRLAHSVDMFLVLNYSKRRTNTARQVEELLRSRNLLNPVETDS